MTPRIGRKDLDHAGHPAPERVPRCGARRGDAGAVAPVAGLATGPVVLGVTAGAQAMLAALLLVSRAPDPAMAAQLTLRGRSFFRPEYDLPLYAAGCLISLALACVLGVRDRRRAEARAGGEAASATARAALPSLLAVLATAAFLVSLARLPSAPAPRPLVYALALVAPGVFALLTFLACDSLGAGRHLEALERRLRRGLRARPAATSRDRRVDPPAGGRPDSGPGQRRIAADVAAAALIALLVAIPSGSRLAGRFAVLDSLPFHHWDFFVMGPALRYLAGGALGTEVYSQYGVAWPVLHAWLSPWLGLSYGSVAVVAVVCGAAYFVGLFLALRLFLASPAWAASGAVLAILVQMHIGVVPEMTIWMTPSSSVLRSPMDVWFFLALLLHARSGRGLWAGLAGALAGLAILFETDTGIFLAATLAFYLACRFRCPDAAPEPASEAGKPLGWARLPTAGLALGALAGVTLSGLAIAGRGTIHRPEFWAGWLEPLRLYSGGMSALPVTTADGLAGPVLFLGMAVLCLSVVGLLLVALAGRRAPRGLLVGGCLSTYGLCQLIQYVNRSHPWNLYHAGVVPCAILIGLAATATRRMAGERPIAVWTPRLALGLALWAMAASPSFRAYPHPWDRLAGKREPGGLTLMPGVRGLPAGRLAEVQEFQSVVRWLRAARTRGISVAVLDPADTRFYLASGCPPWGRYTSLPTHIIRKDQLAEHVRSLSARDIDCWIACEPDFKGTDWGDVHEALLGRIRVTHVLEGRIGRYGIWRARGLPLWRPHGREQLSAAWTMPGS